MICRLEVDPEERAGSPRQLQRVAQLPLLLAGCTDVAQLFARAAAVFARECRFDRAVVLTLSGDHLTAETTDPLDDPASDLLRRQVLATPVPLRTGTTEAEVAADGLARPSATPAHSTLADRLELVNPCFGAIAPVGETLALVVLDRGGRRVDEADAALVAVCGAIVAAAVGQTIQQTRIGELAGELRQLTVSAQALMSEIVHAPLALPTERGPRAAFPLHQAVEPVAGDRLSELLSEREITVARLVADGLSNREIAQRLFLSPATVKGHVARILRKLGATNRAEAATKLAALARTGANGPISS